MKILRVAVSLTLGLAAAGTVAAPPTQNVTIDNTPLPVTVENPQPSITVDNSADNPVPVELQNPQTSMTIDNNETNPVPVIVQNPPPPSKQPQFVGFSTATYDGGQGIVTYTNACQQAFPGSRMCTSKEFLNTRSFTAPPAIQESAWIRPTYVPVAIASGASNLQAAILDVSGVSSIGQYASSGLSCQGWTNSADGSRGLLVTSVGGFVSVRCNAVRSVACCQ